MNLLNSIYDIIIENKNPFNNCLSIINMIFGVLGCLIFCEIITLHFCNLDKDSIENII